MLESEQVRLKNEQKLKACQENLKLERVNQVWFERSKVNRMIQPAVKSCLAVIKLNRSHIWVCSPVLLQSKKQFLAIISFSDHFGVYVAS